MSLIADLKNLKGLQADLAKQRAESAEKDKTISALTARAEQAEALANKLAEDAQSDDDELEKLFDQIRQIVDGDGSDKEDDADDDMDESDDETTAADPEKEKADPEEQPEKSARKDRAAAVLALVRKAKTEAKAARVAKASIPKQVAAAIAATGVKVALSTDPGKEGTNEKPGLKGRARAAAAFRSQINPKK